MYLRIKFEPGWLSRYSDGYGLNGLVERFFSTPQRPDLLCPRGRATGSVKLTTDLYLVERSRMVELYLHFPIRLHDVVIN
jgi:hypothetical protein